MDNVPDWLAQDPEGGGQAILDALPAHIALLDASGRIAAVNAAWRAFAVANTFSGAGFGVGADYLAVCARAQAQGSEGAGEALAGLRAVLAGERAQFSLEYPCHSPDTRRWFRLQVVPLYPGRNEGVVVMHLDITAHRHLQEQLRAAHRLEAVGQLTGGVAHDFNNLLTVVAGNAELLVERLSERPQELGLARMILEAAQRGSSLTQRLLAFSRRQALEARPVRLGELVRGMERLLRRAVGEDIELVLMAGDSQGHVLVDPAQMENALLNLCLNARDAMPEGGHVVVAVHETNAAPTDIDPLCRGEPGDYLCLQVVDSGPGIPAELLPKVVEPFFSTKPPGQGTGLGLSMVYGLVKQSGGYMDITSQDAKGTSVRICLPRLPDEVVAARVPPGEPVPPRGHESILLVEDDPLVRDYAFAQLMSLGYHVVVTASGPEALAVLQGPENFDLLFTDVMMPGGMNGAQLAEAARALRPGLPVLYCSGYSEEALARDGRLPEGVHVLAKPYRKQALAERIRHVLSTPVEENR